jgi:hypothetical protein
MTVVKKVINSPAAVKKSYVPAASSGKLELPKSKSKPETDLSKVMWLLYGERKIGKTSLAAEFDDPLFFMFEPGGKALSIRQVNIPEWGTFKEYLTLLEKNPGYCKTVVIDTGYQAYEKCLDWVCKTHGISHPSDEEWGKGWDMVRKEFTQAHDRIFNMGLGFIVTAHSEIKEVLRRDGSKYHKLSVQLGGAPFKYYAGVADIIAYYQYDDKGQRELTVRGDSFIEAGCRLTDAFRYTDGTEISHIPIGNKGTKKAYEILLNAFANKLIKPKA